MPAAETNVAGHTFVWDVFLPGVVLPTALFLILYAYPFFERWVTGPAPEQHLCDRPRNQPTRTALGVAALSAYAVLLLAGGQDVLSYVFHVPFELLTYTLRAALFVVPFVVYHTTKRACLGLQAADRRRLLEAGTPRRCDAPTAAGTCGNAPCCPRRRPTASSSATSRAPSCTARRHGGSGTGTASATR